MSEIKRPALISFNTNKVEDRKAKEFGKTVRISLILPEPNEDTCPEYNYKEELATAKKREKIKQNAMPPPPTPNGLDPFADDDDDVRRIAQEMEAKYGVSGPQQKRKRKGRRDDYADIGMGYDESDSFIDNTDGYDEMIPQNVTTLHGGFYINCGALEFKTDDEASSEVSSSSSSSSEEEEDVDGVSKVNGRKRILSSDSEGERETETELDQAEKKQKLQPSNGEVPKLERKKLFGHEKIKEMKKKRAEEKKKSSTVKELLKEKRNDTNQVLPQETPAEKADKEESKDSMKENKKPVPMDNISDIIESVVMGVEEELRKIPSSVHVKPTIQEKPAIIHDMDGESSQDGSEEIVKLPENLSNDIVEIVEKIKELARSSTEGKVKFLSGPVCDILLRLEKKCKCLGKQSRVKIYEHLAPFVRCRKETLIKRAKNLMLEDEQKNLKLLLHKLKGDIENIMPTLLETYERESQKVMQKKFSRESLTNEENKQLRLPKRRFAWNDDTRKRVRDIVTLRKKCFLLEGKSKESLDLLMIAFLKTDLQTLWPDGWMSMTALQRVCAVLLTPDVKKVPSIPLPTIPSELTTTKELQKLSSNTNLSITPIIPTTSKSAIPDVITKNDLTVNKIDNLELPAKSGVTITPAVAVNTTKSTTMEKIDFSKPKHDNVIIIGDSPHRSVQKVTVDSIKPKEEIVAKPETDFQVVDLTDQSDRKKKSKKHYETKEEITGNVALNHLIAESLNDVHTLPQNLTKSNSYPGNSDFGKKASDGDDIQKVMEDLIALQKLASPVKQEDSMTGSPVSVIAFNKSFSPKALSQQASVAQRAVDFNTGFQEAFQRQLYTEFSTLAQTQPAHSTPTSSKSHYNSSEKFAHQAGFSNDKYYQASNNNYNQQNSSKLKTLPQQQSGSCNIIDDMLANFFTEYGYPKAAGHLPKQPQK